MGHASPAHTDHRPLPESYLNIITEPETMF